MDEQKIKFDPQQFAELLRRVEAGKKSIWSPSSLLQLVQVFAILVAGIWVFLEYISFRSENAQLTLKQQALSLEMARATLALQEKKEALTSIELERTQEARHKAKWSLDIHYIADADDEALYEVDVNFALTNTSDTEFKVTYSLVEVFLADPASLLTLEKPIVQVAFPPDITDSIYNQQDRSKQIWRRLAGQAHVLQNSGPIPFILTNAGYTKIIRGGGGTQKLKADETSLVGYAFLLRAKPEAWVGAVVHLGFDDGRYRIWKRAEPLTQSKPGK